MGIREDILEVVDSLAKEIYQAHVELAEALHRRRLLRNELWHEDLRIRQSLWEFGPPGRNEDERKLRYDTAKEKSEKYQEIQEHLLNAERDVDLARARLAAAQAKLQAQQIRTDLLTLPPSD